MGKRVLLSLATIFLAAAALAADPTYTDPDKADAAFPFQGEYVAKVKSEKGEKKVGLQVGVLGGSHYHIIMYLGGLPGEGWDKKHKDEADGEIKEGALVFEMGVTEVKIKDGVAIATNVVDSSVVSVRLDKVKRSSPTLGAKPPDGAVVLFDGKSADTFDGGKMTEDGLLEPGCTSKQKFGSCKLHIEFRTPLQPNGRGVVGRGVDRGASAIYVGGRYQMITFDSFGLGAFHGGQDPNPTCDILIKTTPQGVNMCLPPLAWQTYDIDYTAAKYARDKLMEYPRMTILHNGVVIQKDVHLPDRSSGGAPITKLGPEPGPIYLPDHGTPVRYRNIWMVETK